jgi:hypothetical protein
MLPRLLTLPTGKFFGTIKDNPYEDFKEMIDSIKEQARLIQDVAIKGQQAEGRVIHAKLDSYGRALIQGIARVSINNTNLSILIKCRNRSAETAELEQSSSL